MHLKLYVPNRQHIISMETVEEKPMDPLLVVNHCVGIPLTHTTSWVFRNSIYCCLLLGFFFHKLKWVYNPV